MNQEQIDNIALAVETLRKLSKTVPDNECVDMSRWLGRLKDGISVHGHLPPKNIQMGCNTSGCAAGWLAFTVPEFRSLLDSDHCLNIDRAKDLFGLELHLVFGTSDAYQGTDGDMLFNMPADGYGRKALAAVADALEAELECWLNGETSTLEKCATLTPAG